MPASQPQVFDRLYETMVNTNFDPRTHPIPDGTRILAGLSSQIAEQVKSYLTKSGAVTPLANSVDAGQIFLVGGLDLTPAVAELLMAKYRYTPMVRQVVHEVLTRNRL